MKTRTLAIVALLALTACGQNNKVTPERKAISFRAGVLQYVTKATDTAFENGDAISLFAGEPVAANNVKLSYDGSALVPEHTVYWGVEQTSATDFTAIYPYGSYSSASADLTVGLDQSDPSVFKASDFMKASVSAAPADGAVVLPFKHAMSKLVVKITNNTSNVVEGVKLAGVYTTLTANGAADAATVQAYKAGETFELIVAPQTSKPMLTVVTRAGDYVFEGGIEIAAGLKGTIELTMEEDRPDPTPDPASFTFTISDWGAGETFTFTPYEEGGEGGDTGDETVVSVTFADSGYENSEEVTSVTIDTNVTVSFDKGTGTVTPKYYTTGSAIRVYGGNTITVSSSKTISSVKFTFGEGDGTTNPISAETGTYEEPTWTGSANSVKFTIGGTSGNRRIAGISVIYK